MRRAQWLLLLPLAAAFGGCADAPLDTRTFEVQYLAPHEVERLIAPYVFTDRESRPGTMSSAEGVITVRETVDNLDKIARVLEEFDRPRPSVMLHFQIIEADGETTSDPAIAEVEAELRRLFRFEGYQLVAETQVGGIQGTGIRQMVVPSGRGAPRPGGASDAGEAFMIRAGVTEVRTGGQAPTVTLDVLLAANIGDILSTTVTIPAGHSVVLGTASPPGFEAALILVVRAEIVESMGAASPDSTA